MFTIQNDWYGMPRFSSSERIGAWVRFAT